MGHYISDCPTKFGLSFNGSCYFYSGASVQTTYDGASAVSKIHRFRWELNPQLTITGLEVWCLSNCAKYVRLVHLDKHETSKPINFVQICQFLCYLRKPRELIQKCKIIVYCRSARTLADTLASINSVAEYDGVVEYLMQQPGMMFLLQNRFKIFSWSIQWSI